MKGEGQDDVDKKNWSQETRYSVKMEVKLKNDESPKGGRSTLQICKRNAVRERICTHVRRLYVC